MRNIFLLIAFLVLGSIQSQAQVSALKLGGFRVYITELLRTGAFKTTGTLKGLSLEGDSLSLHPATSIHPGAVSLNDQFMGNGTKTFIKNGNSLVNGIVLINDNADVFPEGIAVECKGAAEYSLGRIATYLNTVTGSSMSLNVSTSSGLTSIATLRGDLVALEISGFTLNNVVTVANGTVDVSTSNSFKRSSYNLKASGVLILPDPTTLPEGVSVNFTNTNLSGTDAVIDTPVNLNDFWGNSSGTPASNIVLPSGAVLTGKLEVISVSGANRWVVTFY